MKTFLIAAVATAVMVPLALPSEAAKCSRVSGQGTAVTNLLATANANMALEEAMKAKGLKAKGKSAVSCKYEVVLSTCTATQRGCK